MTAVFWSVEERAVTWPRPTSKGTTEMGRPGPTARSWRLVKVASALVAAMLASGLSSATGEAAGTLPGSSSAPVAAENPVATAPAPVVGNASPAPVRAKVAALAKPAYELIFTPLTALPAQVKAPSVKQTAAFAALNALLSAETRFSEDIIGMGVSLQRAQAASAAPRAQAGDQALAAHGVVRPAGVEDRSPLVQVHFAVQAEPRRPGPAPRHGCLAPGGVVLKSPGHGVVAPPGHGVLVVAHGAEPHHPHPRHRPPPPISNSAATAEPLWQPQVANVFPKTLSFYSTGGSL